MKRIAVLVLLGTFAGLVSVYGEIEAVKIGYTIRQQEMERSQALDRSRALAYNIARLKSPETLGRRLKAQRIELSSPKAWQTLTIATAAQPQRPSMGRLAAGQLPYVSRFFIGTAQAEAKESS